MLRPCALLAGLLLFVLPQAAKADLKLCNRTSYVLQAATSTIKNTDSLTQGWLRLVPGDQRHCSCKGPLGAGSYLVYARSALAHAGPPRAWGGAFPVCVKDGDFVLHQTVTQPICTAADTFSLSFAPVKMSGKREGERRDWNAAWISTKPPAFKPSSPPRNWRASSGFSVTMATRSPLIDGRPSKPTEAALADFPQENEIRSE